eukprot:CAMPEP_0196594018 /NCGR_PEP_ID=MMETSP1081-20130531/77151_1 /TAXON_ID=36882 /ORGANISM="Pyramimonas amylifera, Strain CCMP720" /LENGTH=405 /DNA_ID=CAMNT_0041918163 /DNA_START=366 /DNA_END=1583 /DNA_ORIENTATION=+
MQINCQNNKKALEARHKRDKRNGLKTLPTDAIQRVESSELRDRWVHSGFPSYLQSQELNDDEDFCGLVDSKEREGSGSANHNPKSWSQLYDPKNNPESPQDDLIWGKIREDAQADAAEEPLLSSFMYGCVLSHESFDRALAFVLSQHLASSTLLATHLIEVFERVLREHPGVCVAARADLLATKMRDPACISYAQPLIYYKGYQAIQAHRISHALWINGQRVLALTLQSRMSEVYAIDIHPAAQIGKGILLDHGTGCVIGETAVIGDKVSILHGVTLGGTGKDGGDRHPKIGEGVLIGASSTILGNIKIGKGSMIASGSLVLKPVRPYTMVAGSPAKEVGHTYGPMPAITMKQQVARAFCQRWEDAVRKQDQPDFKSNMQVDSASNAQFHDGSGEPASQYGDYNI